MGNKNFYKAYKEEKELTHYLRRQYQKARAINVLLIICSFSLGAVITLLVKHLSEGF